MTRAEFDKKHMNVLNSHTVLRKDLDALLANELERCHKLSLAVTDFILAVDKLMSGPPAPIRGKKLAELVTILQHSNAAAAIRRLGAEEGR